MLRAIGKRAPWDPDFDHEAPPCRPGLRLAPPDFVGVGVQKAGTTWWHSLIEQHPQVYRHPGYHKERHFFDRFWQEPFGADDVAAYQRWFPRPPGRLSGEWTPDYCCYEWIPPLLRKSAPDAKVLFLLRDPVERYRSGLSHYAGLGQPLTSLLASDAFRRGLYVDQLASYEALFGRERLLILQFETCRDSPLTELRRTFTFLGIDDGFAPTLTDETTNRSGKQIDLPPDRRASLVELYAGDVVAAAARYPEIDLDRWPNFAS
jgi:hypothetical protein